MTQDLAPKADLPRKSLPPVVRQLGWVSFLTDASSEMIYPLLPVLLRELGGGAASLGAMEGIAESVSALVKWVSGRMADRTPHKKGLVVAGYGLATLMRPLMAFAAAPWHVVAFRTADRIGKGLRGAPRDVMIAQAVAPEARARAFGFHRMMDNLGSVAGPLIAFALLRGLRLPVRVIFGLAIVPGCLAVLTLVFRVRDPGAAAGPAIAETSRAAVVPRLVPSARRYLAAVTLFTMGASADSFLLLRAVQLGVPDAFVPLLWLALSGARAASNIPGARLSDRAGLRRTLTASWAAYALIYAGLGMCRTAQSFVPLVLLYGLALGSGEGIEKALLARYAPHAARGRAFGAFSALTGLAVLPANGIFGLLYAHHAAWAFAFSAALAGLGALALAFVVRDPPASSLETT